MTTWEEALENLEFGGSQDDVATIRKHIEDQAAEALRDIREAIDGQIELRDELSALMDANIYQQRRIEELEAALAQSRAAHNLDDVQDIVDATFHPSEPETPRKPLPDDWRERIRIAKREHAAGPFTSEPETGIGKPRHSGGPKNDQGIPL